MKLKNSIAMIVALLFASLLMQSCFTGGMESDSDENEMEGMDSTYKRVSKLIVGNSRDGCFAFAYPIKVTLQDASIQMLRNKTEFLEFHEAWERAYPDALRSPGIHFPLKVALPDGSSGVIKDQEALNDLIRACESLSNSPNGSSGN